MSYVDGSDEDGGDYPSKNDIYDNYTSYDYDTSSKSLLISVVASYAPKNYGQMDEPSCSEQEIGFKTPIVAAFANDPSKPSSPSDVGKQDLDRLIQKMQDDIKSDPDKYSLQCFGPPSMQPREYLDRPPSVPFPQNAADDPNYPASPDDLPENGLPMPFKPGAGTPPPAQRGVIPPEYLMD